MDNINDILKGIIPEPKELNIPDELPSDQEVLHLATRALKAVLDDPKLSSADAPLLEALVSVRNSTMGW